MYVGIITPAPPGSRYGNRVTAVRWASIIKQLGHRVVVRESYLRERYDLLVALHARRSSDAIDSFHRQHPDRPTIVALTGTDLYRDLARTMKTQRALEIADLIIVLQPQALDELRPRWREKTRVVYQSVAGLSVNASRHRGATFDVCVVGHLRWVKDPFRAAMAARLLPAASRIRVIHVGGAMAAREEERARKEMLSNPRYKWIDEVPPSAVRRVLTHSNLFVISSRLEGGANALGEAIAAGLPVLASRIPGSIGILGEDYRGYFEVGDTRQLANLMRRCETDPEFLQMITSRCHELAPVFDPIRERAAWKSLLDELFVPAENDKTSTL